MPREVELRIPLGSLRVSPHSFPNRARSLSFSFSFTDAGVFVLFIVDPPAIEHSSTIDMSVSHAVPLSSRSFVRSFVRLFARFSSVHHPSVHPLLQGENGPPLLMLLLDGARTAARQPTTDPAAAAAGS